MAFSPTPKKAGDLIRSQDWNEAMQEIVRLESAKIGTAGGSISGALSVQNLGLGTVGPVIPHRPLTVRGSGGTYLNVINDAGAHEVLLGADGAGGIVSTMTNHDLQLRAGGNVARLTVKADGKVGIGTTTPEAQLDVVGTSWAQHLRLTNTGTGGAGPCLYFNAINRDWAILGTNGTAGAGDQKLGFYDATSHVYRMVIDPNGNVGIGTVNPQGALDVTGAIRAGTSEIYFTDSNHTHTGIGNAFGFAAIENAASHNTLMILGRTRSPFRRSVTVWDDLTVAGNLQVNGSKSGFIVDNFINSVGDLLEQGDVVVLGRNEIGHYYGAGNSIPVPEVDLTDQAYDTRVCGIVDSVVSADSLTPYDLPTEAEITAAQSEKNARRRKAAEKALAARSFHPLQALAAPTAEGLNSTQVQVGQLGKMVTLGAYAWCKVDADIAPIAVGDLLTTSPTRGHAQKVTEPARAVGAIIGKALGARKKGKGKIPVLVMMQ